MSITINKKINISKEGVTTTYHYIYVIFGANTREFYNCGLASEKNSYEKARKILQEILTREHLNKLKTAEQKIAELKNSYLIKFT